jgi:hypothetical protein
MFLLEQAGRLAAERLFDGLDKGVVVSHHFLPEQTFFYRDRWVDFADAAGSCWFRAADELGSDVPVRRTAALRTLRTPDDVSSRS